MRVAPDPSPVALFTEERQIELLVLQSVSAGAGDAGTNAPALSRLNQNMTTKITQKITPFLWFDDKAEEAAKFYASIFKNSKVGKITRYDEEAAKTTGRPADSVMTVEFELEGQQFVALNGGPMFKFTEAISFVVNCETQEEVDYYWSKLSAGGEESRCGWLTDKFGLSWQVVPVVLIEMLADQDTAKAKRVTHAMLQMDKIDIPTLKKAYDGR